MEERYIFNMLLQILHDTTFFFLEQHKVEKIYGKLKIIHLIHKNNFLQPAFLYMTQKCFIILIITEKCGVPLRWVFSPSNDYLFNLSLIIITI